MRFSSLIVLLPALASAFALDSATKAKVTPEKFVKITGKPIPGHDSATEANTTPESSSRPPTALPPAPP
ncbi:unnamed protein product [Tilletia controversa]|nr:unnamed protein product [Tilletia caries]CAD6926346.1 unnamed protein product [Tilletia controversa]CAD6937474.1 unnamed protein product [Tilletia controversa]CAD6984305.1 unnamed protein product [Tilletia controversa]